jgi:hypothetical protein
LKRSLTTSHDHNIALAQNDNLVALRGLSTSLRAFSSLDTPNFELFGPREEVLRDAFQTMQTRIPKMSELW